MNNKSLNALATVATMLLMAIPCTLAQSSYFNAVTNLNPAGYWPMHEVATPAQGDIETNYGSLGLLGTGYYPDFLVNEGAFIRQMPGAVVNDPDTAVFFTGPAGGGTGSNGLFVPHTSPKATLTPPFSVECWFMATNIGTGQGDVLSEADGSKTVGFRLYYQNSAPSDPLNLLTYDGATSGQLNFTTSNYPTNTWHHIVLTCDAATNMTAWFDGNKVDGPTAFAGKYKADTHQPFTVGTGLGNQRAFHGLIDEVAVYTNVITDINQHFNDGSSGPNGAYFSDVTNDNPTIYLRMDSAPYTAPAVTSWPVLVNDGLINGAAPGNGVYSPGTVPGLVAGGSYGLFPVGLSGSDVAPLSGVSSYADAGNASAYNPTGTNSFTISALFRGNPTDTNRVQSIVGHGTNSWQLGLTVGGFIVFNSGTNSGTVVATGTAPGDVESTSNGYDDGNWHQVVAVHNVLTNVLYVDGVANKTNILTAANNIGNSLDVMIGADPSYTTNPIGLGRQFAGQVCEVAFFTNALTAAQAQNLFNQSGVEPVITLEPVSATLNGGTNFTNTVGISAASAPIYVQWYANGAAISGATNASLIFNPVQPSNASPDYYVVVSNSFDAVTSSVVSLTVYGVPTITKQFPVAQTNPATLYGGSSPSTLGSSPTFSVSALGPAIAYQWMTNGTAALGATNTSFTFTNCQMNSPTEFACALSNSYGSVTTMTWGVSYVAAPTAPFPQVVLGYGPLAYWRLNELDNGSNNGNAGAICTDYQSANNGLYTNVYLGNILGGTGYSPGTDPSETAAEFGYFPNPGDTGCFAGSIGTNIDFSAISGKNAEFTAQVWANSAGNGQPENAGMLAKGYFNGEEFTLDEGGPGSAVRFAVRSAAGTLYSASSSIQLGNDSNWHFVVGVCDEANATLSLWVDGVLAATATIPAGSGITNSSSVPLMIGSRSTSATSPGNNQFAGFLNEATIFNYALSSNQIIHEFQPTGVAPSINPEPPNSVNADYGGILSLPVDVLATPPVTYRWFDTTSNVYVSGQTNATLLVSNVTASDTYELIVSNAYGSVTSTPVSINVVQGSPQIYVDVQNPFYGIEGVTTNNSVQAYGTAPLAYQWQYYNGTNWVNLTDNGRIIGSQTSTLTFAPPYPSDDGSYQVVVTNSAGSTTSSTATFTVAGLPLNFNGNGVLWQANGSARINNGLLSLTDPNNGGGSGSFFFEYPLYIAAFDAAFTYQATSAGNGLADGMSFCLQNDSRGAKALASGGGGLGVGNGGAITPSAELMLDVFGGSGFAFGTNGANVPANGAVSVGFAAPGNVALNSGDPINITVNYANGEMAVTFADTNAGTSFNTNLSVGDLRAILGADTAYVGFTGAYGGSTSVQTITNFSFFNPATLSIQVEGNTATLSWPEDILGYVLQESSNLAASNWTIVTNSVVGTNEENQVVVPVGNTNVFYRLMLVQ